MDEIKVLSRRVKMLRLAYGVPQTKMAEAIGVSQTNLSNVESGRTALTVQNLFKIQKVLGCKMSDFFVDFDGEAEQASEIKQVADRKQEYVPKCSIELEDAVNILKLLKAVEIKGL